MVSVVVSVVSVVSVFEGSCRVRLHVGSSTSFSSDKEEVAREQKANHEANLEKLEEKKLSWKKSNPARKRS